LFEQHVSARKFATTQVDVFDEQVHEATMVRAEKGTGGVAVHNQSGNAP